MAGLVEINKERSWSVTGWVFESVDFKLLEGARSTVPLIVSLEGAKMGSFMSSCVALSQAKLLMTQVSC